MGSQLTSSELQRIFRTRIVPDLHRDAPNKSSHVVAVAAQPGAGKTVAIQRMLRDEPALPIIGDDLRKYHPDYSRLMKSEDPSLMPATTAHAAGQWLRMSLDYAATQKWNVVYETTLRSPKELVRSLRTFHDNGYETAVNVLAVPRAVSLLDATSRFVTKADTGTGGRAVALNDHDSAFFAAPNSIRQLQKLEWISIKVSARNGDTLYPLRIDDPIEALEAGRTLTPDQLRSCRQQLARLVPSLARMPEQSQEALAPTVAAVRAELDGRSPTSPGSLSTREKQAYLRWKENIPSNGLQTSAESQERTKQAHRSQMNRGIHEQSSKPKGPHQ